MLNKIKEFFIIKPKGFSIKIDERLDDDTIDFIENLHAVVFMVQKGTIIAIELAKPFSN